MQGGRGGGGSFLPFTLLLIALYYAVTSIYECVQGTAMSEVMGGRNMGRSV